MKLNEVLTEMEGEVIKSDKTHAARMAGQFLRATGGAPKLAKAMAKNFLETLLNSIDEQHGQLNMRQVGNRAQEQRRPHQQPTGYEQDKGMGDFSQSA